MALGDDTDLDSTMAGGGTGYYNPSLGLMAIQQPDMFVQHLARNGIGPPADFPDDFDHEDAHRVLAQHIKDQSRAPGMGETPQLPASQLPQQGSFDERFNDAFPGPGSQNVRSYSAMEHVAPEDVGGPEGPIPTPRPRPAEAPPRPTEPSVMGSIAQVPKLLPGLVAQTAKPKPTSEALHAEPAPTPAPEAASTTGGAAPPAGDTSKPPGGLNEKEPDAKTSSTAEKKTSKPGDTIDSFGKALAGVAAMKPPPVNWPHAGPIPHPGSQIARSTTPTEILKELSAIGHPSGTLRLGAALKGR